MANPRGDSTSGGRRARAISTVANVSMALLLIVVCIAVLAGPDTGSEKRDPTEAAHTAETLGSSTVTVTYSLAPVLSGVDSERVSDPDAYNEDALERATHGPALGHLARAAVFNTQFDAGSQGERLSPLGSTYSAVLDERLQASLVASQFETNVTAVWEPFENASMRGTATAGKHPPPDGDTSLVRMSVSSGLPDAQSEALAAVESDDDFGAVAEAVAEAFIEGQFPLPATQRALERDGVERDVTIVRYLRTVALVNGIDRDDPVVADNLERSTADAATVNAHLVERLAAQLEPELAATFDTANEAAAAVSTGEVSISVTTWGS